MKQMLSCKTTSVTKNFLLCFFLVAGCTVSEPDPYEAGKCYEGTYIRGFCPSVAVVSVTNANIGIKWDYNGKKYSNALAIHNFEIDSLGPDRTIYFTIDVDETAKGGECYLPIHCQMWLFDTSSPEVGICAKTISNRPCDQL
ncbi:hypothetical protein GCM10027275_47040 [Rhabdobacter roseus]|uniref:Uncharacterized protein n=1 Tax=Rhabdobacter roseus TaxID=1655419 RepID=A0A840U226_9BACT|nr:hypothetical protein [Rhabdobacter roseus]MBB5286418.1 hypothetical protein [Rhabdobacter roseus]